MSLYQNNESLVEEQLSLKNLLLQYLEIAWRRKWCALPIPFMAAAVLYHAASLPPVYQSEGVLLVEDQNIPPELIRTTVTSYAAEQMEVIRQQIESTENVASVIAKYGLYQASEGADTSQLAQRFRDNMSVDTIDVDVLDPTAGRRRIISIAFRVSFQDESPELAQQVAQELIQLFQDKNTLTRKKEAEQTSSFLREEADNLQKLVAQIDDEMAAFRSENGGSLPELLEFNLETIANSEQTLRDNQVAIDNLREQEQLLSIELRSMDPYTGAPIGSAEQAGAVGLTASGQLAQRRAELAQLSIRYSESHPTIRRLKLDIATLEAQTKIESGEGEESIEDESLYSPAYLNLRYRVGSIDRDIQNLLAENDSLREQITVFNQRVERTYIVERELEELLREYNAASDRYDQLRNAQYEAEVAQSLEEKNQVEGLTVIEQPNLPRYPIGPERLKIAVMGIGLSGVLCIGFALLLEFLDERVRGTRGYERILGSPPLVVLPIINTTGELRAKQFRIRRTVKLSLIAVSAVSIILALLLVVLN